MQAPDVADRVLQAIKLPDGDESLEVMLGSSTAPGRAAPLTSAANLVWYVDSDLRSAFSRLIES